MVNYQMRESTRSFLFWQERAHLLEEIIKDKDNFLTKIRATNSDNSKDNRQFYSLTQRTCQYFRTVNDLKDYCGENIGFSERRTLAQAEKIVLDAAALIKKKSPPLETLEKKLNKLTRAWFKEHYSIKKEEYFKKIVGESSYYRDLTGIETVSQPGEKITNSFYIDFSCSLSFLADEKLADKYVNQYAGAETVGQLQKLKQKYEEEFLRKRDEERNKLRKKYNNPLFPLSAQSEYCLIDAEPISAFQEFYADLRKVLANPNKYLNEKRKIECKKEKLSLEMKKLREGQLSLDDLDSAHLTRLSSLFNRQGFDDLGSLYLRKNIRQYQSLLENGREEMGRFIAGTIGKMAAEIDAGAGGSADKLGFLLEKEGKVSKFKEISNGLNLKVKDSVYSPIEDKLRRMKDYYSHCQPSIPQKQPELQKMKRPLRENYSTKGEIEVGEKKTIAKEEYKSVSDTSIGVNDASTGDVLIADSSPTYDFPLLRSEPELFEFACQQRKKVADPNLARYCSLVAGVSDDGWDLWRRKEERLEDVKNIDFSRLEGRDKKVYEVLRQGVSSCRYVS